MSWKKPVAVAALCLGLALLWRAAPASAGPDEPSNAEILRNMAVVVFGSEFVGQDARYVRKWTGPVRVAITGDGEARYADLVADHLATLRRLTGLDITRVAAGDRDANGRIMFLGRRDFVAAARTRLGAGKPGTNDNLACFAVFKTDGSGRIFAFDAVIPVPTTRDEAEACIIEEVTQVLGLPNDSFDIHPSIFNDDDEYHRLTWQDELMVRVLYDPSITPRMSLRAFAAAARNVIEALHPESGALLVATAPASRPDTQLAAARAVPEPAIETLPLARGQGRQ